MLFLEKSMETKKETYKGCLLNQQKKNAARNRNELESLTLEQVKVHNHKARKTQRIIFVLSKSVSHLIIGLAEIAESMFCLPKK